MSRIDHAIWWHIYPLGFVGAPIRQIEPADQVTHRLPRLIEWLDYATELGVNGLLLGPIFASSSHGYDTLDHFTIDPRLGDESDFDALVSACRSKGLGIMLDGVFNHVGDGHPLLRRALADGEHGEPAGMFRIDWGTGRPEAWEGHSGLANLDHRDPRVADLVVDIMTHWLRRGIAGWRLDVAYAVPTAFWRNVIGRVRQEFPDAVFVGEVIRGDYAEFVRESTTDSVTQYELWKAIWSSLNDRNFWELAWGLQRHDEFVASFVPTTFVGNHDVTRIASMVGDDGAALALVVLMTVAGMPCVYYGDEQAYRGVKTERFGGDDEVRPVFPSGPGEFAAVGQWMFRLHQELIGLRRRHSWLQRARTKVIAKDNSTIRYVSRGPDGQELAVLLDVTNRPHAQISSGTTLLFEYQGQPCRRAGSH